MPSSRHRQGAFLAALLSGVAYAQSSQPALRLLESPAESASRPAQSYVSTDSRDERFARENDAIWTGLNRSFRGEIAFEDLPLDQAIEAVVSQASVQNTHVRWQTLVDAGIARDKPITVKLRDSTVWRSLELILDEAGGGDVRLGYEPIDGVLVIATEEDLGRRMETRVYPIADLLTGDIARMRERIAALRAASKPANLAEAPSAEAERHFRAAIERMKAAESSSATNDPDEGGRADLPMRGIIAIICNCVCPDHWDFNGGTGTISAYSDSLVVRNNAAVHRALSRLLNDLRAAEIENADRKRAHRGVP